MKNDSLLFGLLMAFLGGVAILSVAFGALYIYDYLGYNTVTSTYTNHDGKTFQWEQDNKTGLPKVIDGKTVFKVEGSSMVERGYSDGDTVIIDTTKRCEVGDDCVFRWEKCLRSNYCQNIDSDWIKSLVGLVDNSCFVFEGNPSGENTADWRNIGCIEQDRVTIRGVVVKDTNFRQPVSAFSKIVSDKEHILVREKLSELK
mgnify:CR=1 FL=1